MHVVDISNLADHFERVARCRTYQRAPTLRTQYVPLLSQTSAPVQLLSSNVIFKHCEIICGKGDLCFVREWILYLHICPQDPFKSSMIETLLGKNLRTIRISWSLSYEVFKMCTGFKECSFSFGRMWS